MATATIKRAWQDANNAYMAAAVTETGGDVVEYIGSVPLATLSGLTNAQKKAALSVAVKAVRDAQAQQAALTDLTSAINGNVTV